MRILAIFFVIQATAAIKFPPVTTWGHPEVMAKVEGSMFESVDPCLDYLLNCFLIGMAGPEAHDKSPINEENMMAVVPSPTGRETWSIEELQDAAAIIIHDMGLDRQHTRRTVGSKRLSLEKVNKAMNKINHMNSTATWIKYNILLNLQTILENEAKGRVNKKDGYNVTAQVLDLTVWDPDVVHEALEKTTTNPKLVPFLDFAVHGMFASEIASDKVCVATPVNVIPAKERYYYLPRSTKCLLKKLRKIHQKKNQY